MITFQLGVVEPIVSVTYRFALASLFLFTYCLLRSRRFNFEFKDHLLILVQGLLLFGFNYWLTYIGVTKINSALAAILSTSIVYFNVVFARIFLGDKIRSEVLVGATIGVAGIFLVFLPELTLVSQSEQGHSSIWQGIGLIICGSIFASLGNIVSAKMQRRKIPVLQANALGMFYASGLIALIALSSGFQFSFDWSLRYVGSLIYLALFGSVVAFGAFLTLVGRIGPDKAGYVTLVYPVIAMLFSSLFEDYRWTGMGFFGLIIIVAGNFIAMGKYKSLALYQRWRAAAVKK